MEYIYIDILIYLHMLEDIYTYNMHIIFWIDKDLK